MNNKIIILRPNLPLRSVQLRAKKSSSSNSPFATEKVQHEQEIGNSRMQVVQANGEKEMNFDPVEEAKRRAEKERNLFWYALIGAFILAGLLGLGGPEAFCSFAPC